MMLEIVTFSFFAKLENVQIICKTEEKQTFVVHRRRKSQNTDSTAESHYSIKLNVDALSAQVRH